MLDIWLVRFLLKLVQQKIPPALFVCVFDIISHMLITMSKMEWPVIQCAIENKTLLAQLPYYNCKVLTSAHPQFNSLIDDNRPSRKLLDSLSSLYDLSVFQLNSLDKHIDPDINLTSNKIRSKYYSPHSFAQFVDSKQLQSKISFLHTNIRSLKKNFEEFQHHVLSEMNFRFTIIGVTETRICDRECSFNFDHT